MLITGSAQRSCAYLTLSVSLTRFSDRLLERLKKPTPGSEAESTAAYECLTTIAEWQKAGQAYIEEITEQVMDANQQLSEARSRGDI